MMIVRDPCSGLTVNLFICLQGFERIYADNPGPMVVFATPGMLHGGLSLQIFKKWCTSENNMVRTSIALTYHPCLMLIFILGAVAVCSFTHS